MPDGVITSEGAHMAGVGEIFDRINVELIGKMRELGMVRIRAFFILKIFN